MNDDKDITFLVENPDNGFQTGIAYSPDGKRVETLIGVHSPLKCLDHYCAIHNRPSIHPLSMEPLIWNQYYACMERLCVHNQLHPDKDNFDYFETVGGFPYDHDPCDGCCTEEGYRG